LFVGLTKTLKPPRGGFLLISDEAADITRARVFDPAEHSFHPLAGMDCKKAREIVAALYTIAPQVRTHTGGA
jgi:hypothetical protein